MVDDFAPSSPGCQVLIEQSASLKVTRIVLQGPLEVPTGQVAVLELGVSRGSPVERIDMIRIVFGTMHSIEPSLHPPFVSRAMTLPMLTFRALEPSWWLALFSHGHGTNE